MQSTPSIDLFGKTDADRQERPSLKAMETEAKSLARIVSHLDTMQDEGQDTTHPDTGEIVSDDKYDAMRERLKWLQTSIKDVNEVSYVLKTISDVLDGVTGSQRQMQGKMVKHDPPMVSIDKANGTLKVRQEKLIKWVNDCKKRLGIPESKKLDPEFLAMGYKRDGVAVSLYYVDGRLERAGLRSRDATVGEDVTVNMAHVKGVSVTLPHQLSVCIRGELETMKDVFESLNKKRAEDGERTFANPRNATTGGIHQFDNPEITAKRGVSFVAHSVEWMDAGNPPYKTEIERAKWCSQELGIQHVRIEKFDAKLLQVLEDKAADLNYEVDGIVISANDLEQSEQLGRANDKDTGNPRSKLAWKFSDETASPTLDSVVWATGRTGRITPVGLFRGVKLAQTTVKRCSLHSLGFIARNNIKIGRRIQIRKSGKIIPECLGTFDSKNRFVAKLDAGDDKVPDIDISKQKYPRNCPSCGHALDVVEGSHKGTYDLKCPNSSGCPAQNVNMLVHFLQTFGAKGVAEDVCGKLVENGDVVRPADLYDLTVTQLVGAGVTSRNAILAIARIHMVDEPEKIKDNDRLLDIIAIARSRKKEIPLSKFLTSFGIPGAGKGTSGELSGHFRSFAAIRKASVEDLESVEGVGAKTAQGVYDFFVSNTDAINALLDHIDVEDPKTGKLTGKVFCITGGIEPSKDYWKDKVEALGGKMSGSVSRKTTHVVDGDGEPDRAKLVKAKELAAENLLLILSPDELSDLVN